MKVKLHFFLLPLLLALTANSACGQMQKFKALFLFNFAKNIEWPSHAIDNNIVVTIVGDDKLEEELNELAEVQKVGNHQLVVETATSIDEISNSHMVFLSSSKSSLMPMLVSYQKDSPTLLIGDKQGLCSQGAGISFLKSGGKLNFEICPGNIEDQGLKLAQKLVSLGIEVQ